MAILAARGLAPIFWLLAFTIVVNSLVWGSGDAMVRLGVVGVSGPGVVRGVFFVARVTFARARHFARYHHHITGRAHGRAITAHAPLACSESARRHIATMFSKSPALHPHDRRGGRQDRRRANRARRALRCGRAHPTALASVAARPRAALREPVQARRQLGGGDGIALLYGRWPDSSE